MSTSDRLRTKRPIPCVHRKQDLDEDARKVLCRDCGAELDPFDLLVRRARKGGYDELMRRDAKRRRKELERLQTEERRTKARLKNARRKDADMAVAEERERWKTRLRRSLAAAREIEQLGKRIRRHLGDDALEQPPNPVKVVEGSVTRWIYRCESCGGECARRRRLCFPCEARLCPPEPPDA